MRLRSASPVQKVMNFLSVLKLAARNAFEHDAFNIAKAVAYSSILTLFPALLVLGAVLASSRRLDVYIVEVSDALSRILPTDTATAVEYLRNPHFRPVGFLITTALLTVWTASSAIVSCMEGFRRAYGLPRTWGTVKERFMAFSMVILTGIPMTFATFLIAFGSDLESRVSVLMGHALGPYVLLLWVASRWLIAGMTSVAVIALIYHIAVPRTQPWRTVLPGAIVSTGLWFPATWLFGLYLRNSNEYNVIYGFLGAGIALLVWMYVVSLIVLLGAEINAILFPRTLKTYQAAA